MAKREESYFELLRRPEWQRKRLEVMERAGFACERCGDNESTLNVHHTYYEKGRAPWEYPAESLHCVCEHCHEDVQDISATLKRTLGKLHLDDIDAVLGFALLLTLLRRPDERVAVPTSSVADGIACALPERSGVSWQTILAACDDDGTIGNAEIRRLVRDAAKVRRSDGR